MERKLNFRTLCRDTGLALTHQRQVIFDALVEMHHPSPDEVFEKVKKKIPSISPATVYNTLHTFIEHGIVRELSLHHGTLRVDMGNKPHHHLICTRCKEVMDIDEKNVGSVELKGKLPSGFKVQRIAVEIQGLCSECSRANST